MNAVKLPSWSLPPPSTGLNKLPKSDWTRENDGARKKEKSDASYTVLGHQGSSDKTRGQEDSIASNQSRLGKDVFRGWLFSEILWGWGG